MKPENAIEVRDLKKSFKVYLDKGNSLKEKVIFRNRNKHETRQVLKGISFDVKKGEAIGLIGHNGCGKSTTLKLLTKIIYPDSGSIEMCGRVSSLIELGAGFHPDMSGRENIYTNAAIFGLTKKEIDARLEDIIRFSELEEFIDNPVRTYSSGMYMRLAFAVAINVNADILLIDEILAVGDVNFQQKCFDKMKDIKRAGTTIVIVSHSLDQIEAICDKTYWIDDGKIEAEGKPIEVHELYLRAMDKNMMNRIEKENEEVQPKGKNLLPPFCSEVAERSGNQFVEFKDIRLTNSLNERRTTFYTGDDVQMHLQYSKNQPVDKANIEFSIYRDDGVCCYRTTYENQKGHMLEVKKEESIVIEFPKMGLFQGTYLLNVSIHNPEGSEIYDNYLNVIKFKMFTKEKDSGVSRLISKWN